MAASLEFPFTSAQWTELQRQAMIYKYMMASVPVPPGLLFLDPAASCQPWAVRGDDFNMRFSGSSRDPEPGRCRRTDGKKWRCSRDAAPDKKYCERHMNRGRPRSRKPVELVHVTDRNKKAKHGHSNLPLSSLSVANSGTSEPFGTSCEGIKMSDKTVYFGVTTPSHQESRSLNWVMKEPDFMPTADQELQHMIKLNNSTHFVGTVDEQSKCNYLNLDMVSSEQLQTNTPRGFIDAWSSSVSGDQNIGNANMGHSVHLLMGGSNSLESNGTILDFSSWLSSAPSWTSSTPGGPLAEVLMPPTSTVSNGDSSSAVVTGVSISSPSDGVIQRATVVSFSDSSGASSPTTLRWF